MEGAESDKEREEDMGARNWKQSCKFDVNGWRVRYEECGFGSYGEEDRSAGSYYPVSCGKRVRVWYGIGAYWVYMHNKLKDLIKIYC